MIARDVIRRVRLAPYRPGHGPRFSLTVWDTGRRHARGTTMLGYELRQHEAGRRPIVVFTGEDFSASPMYADDSDRAMAALLGFLTLRPGDTDREYFDGYTPEQLAFAETHAESLQAEVYARYGEDS